MQRFANHYGLKDLLQYSFMAMLLILIATDPTFAQANPFDNATNATNSFGVGVRTIGYSLATLAIFIVGIMAMFNKIEYKWAGGIIGAIVIISIADIINLWAQSAGTA